MNLTFVGYWHSDISVRITREASVITSHNKEKFLRAALHLTCGAVWKHTTPEDATEIFFLKVTSLSHRLVA